MKDIQKLVEDAAQTLGKEFRLECEKHVKGCVCGTQYCEEFPDCDVAQHEVKMLRRRVWERYVMLN